MSTVDAVFTGLGVLYVVRRLLLVVMMSLLRLRPVHPGRGNTMTQQRDQEA